MRWWELTLLVASAKALSSHSPADLFANPKYEVKLSDSALLNETATGLLHQDETVHLLRTPFGQAFLCSVPVVAETPPPPPQQDLVAQQEERSKELERGITLIENMRHANCLYLRQGWFTYSFCYGHDIRQFHEIRLAGSMASSEDPNSDSYTLGQFPTPPVSLAAPKYGSGSPSLMYSGSKVEATLGGEPLGLGTAEGGRYLSMKWEGGTTCDKTGMPRTVDVQFHCNTQSTDRIALIRETSICNYVLIIHTPRLCTISLFLDANADSQGESNTIECRPIVNKIKSSPSPPFETPAAQLVLGSTKEDSTPPVADAKVEPDFEIRFADFMRQPLATDDGEMLTLVYDAETGEVESLAREDDAAVVERENGVKATTAGLETLAKLMQQSIQDALREDDSPKNPKSKDTKTKQADSVRNVLAALNQKLAPSSDDDSPSSDDSRLSDKESPAKDNDVATGSKSHFSSKALADYLKKNRKAITAVVEKERGKRGAAAAAGLKMRKPIVNSPRFQALTTMFGKWYEGEEDAEVEEKAGGGAEGRIKDEL